MSHRKLTLIALTLDWAHTGCGDSLRLHECNSTRPAGEIKKFSSADEIRDYIKNNTHVAQTTYYRSDGVIAPVPCSRSLLDRNLGQGHFLLWFTSIQREDLGTTGYSQTNVQVVGVDEPDFVKNDAQYIYLISGSTLTIVDAYPAASASVLSRTELEDTPREIFINGDRLVLLKTGSSDIAVSSSPQVDRFFRESSPSCPRGTRTIVLHRSLMQSSTISVTGHTRRSSKSTPLMAIT